MAVALATGPTQYVFASDTIRAVGIERKGELLIGTLDETGEFRQTSRLEYADDILIYRGPPYQPILSPPLKPTPVYEFRSGTLIPGVVNMKGYFVPTVGEKVIAFEDYKYRSGARLIWNLPGRFELVPPTPPAK